MYVIKVVTGNCGKLIKIQNLFIGLIRHLSVEKAFLYFSGNVYLTVLIREVNELNNYNRCI